MPHDRFFSDETLQNHQTVRLTGSELHHLQHVMRKKPKEIVEIINGKGQLAKAEIRSLSSRESVLDILEAEHEKTMPSPLYLAQSWIHPSKLDWVLEKGCELGVTKFFLFSSDFSAHIQSSESRKERIKALFISSIKQSGRLYLPDIFLQSDLASLSSLPAAFLFGDIRENAPLLKNHLSLHPLQQPPCLLIGPESGFSLKEISFMEKNLEASGVRLHTNILRSETAAIMGLSLLAHHLQ